MRLNGQAVRDHREVAGLTQEQLGERVGRSQPTIAEIEAGTQGSRPPIGLVYALADALGCKASQLLVNPSAALLAQETAGAEAAVP